MSMLPTLPCGVCGTPITANYCTGCGNETTSELPSFDIRTEDDLFADPPKRKKYTKSCSICNIDGIGIFCIECGASLEIEKPTNKINKQISLLRMMSLAK